MVILGITDGDDSGACILSDGKVYASINEERLNRNKMTIGFPHLSIAEVLRISGLQPAEIDHVAIAAIKEDFHLTPVKNDGWFKTKDGNARRIKNTMTSALAPYLGKYELPKKVYHKAQVRLKHDRKVGIKSILSEMGLKCPISYYDHHYCHAMAAYHASGFDSALTVTLDGGGDGACSHVYHTNGSFMESLRILDSYNSIGNFYAYVTHICGFKAGIHEGKITGLAAHGKPVYKDMFLNLIKNNNGSIENIGSVFYYSAIKKILELLPSDFRKEDLAASIQDVLEEVAIGYIGHWVRKTGSKNIALAGGVFANVKLNQRIQELPEVEQIYIFPAMGDGGLAVGAAYALYRKKHNGSKITTSKLEDVYLGPEYSNKEIETNLTASKLEYQFQENIEKKIAQLLKEGKVVARFNGRMEFGPRALGNRSILYQATDPSVNDWLNKQLNRTEFMPFAPATLKDQKEKCYKHTAGAEHAAKFMTITFDCTDYMQEVSPAAVHIDNTARPQLVDEKINPSFYKIIHEYYKLTGIPSIVNTSFNMHEEPIVCSPEDAIRAFQEGHLDYLAIGDFLVKNTNSSN